MKTKKKSSKKSTAEKIPQPQLSGGLAAPETLTSDQPAAIAPPEQEQKQMTLTLKGLDKRGRNAIYVGAAIALRIGVSAFPGKSAPANILVPDGVFAEKTVREPRKRLTKEERAALPKPTLAEKIAKAEARLAAAKAKLASEQQPAM